MASQLAADTQDSDLAEHERTFRLFVNGLKYGTISVIVILVILAFVTL